MDWKKSTRPGLGVAALVTGAYLALPWFTNSTTLNTVFGWALGVLGAAVLFLDGFSQNWKDNVMIGLAMISVLAAFYLVPSWVPNNNGANIAFGVLLLISGAASFIKR